MPDNFKLISSQKVRAAPISGNIDNPEGGLDALMQVRKGNIAFLLCEKKIQQRWKCLVVTSRCHHQVMVCGERVGWREEARRVIIYTTDQVPGIAKIISL